MVVFKDYYSILEIPINATNVEIKIAYKKQAFRWHPDRNSREDTTLKMQDINEAYLILSDDEARSHYDVEYLRFTSYKKTVSSKANKEYNFSDSYDIQDDLLKKWMSNARMQASKVVERTLNEFKVGAKAAGEEMFKQTIAFVIIGILFFIFLRCCH